jgi:hypothetical protein
MSVTGISDSPLINGAGELPGLTMNSFMTSDQVREHAKQQLEIMRKSELFDTAKPDAGVH